jgi:hypothetical protein
VDGHRIRHETGVRHAPRISLLLKAKFPREIQSFIKWNTIIYPPITVMKYAETTLIDR